MTPDFVLPRAWVVERLGRLAQFRNGINFTKGGEGDPVRIVGVADFWQRSVIWARDIATEIRPNGGLAEDDLLQDGDLLFVRSNGNKALIGRCAIVYPGDDRITFSGFTIRARITSKKTTPEYLAQILQSSFFKRQLYLEGGGTNISNLSQDTLQAFLMPLPPLPEQRRIADILATWDRALDRLDRQITCKREMFISLRESLTGGEFHRRRHSNPWPTATLCQVAALSFSPVDKKAFPGELPVRLCNYLDIFRNHRIDERIQFSSGTASPLELQKFSLREGDVVFTKDSETAEEIAEAAYIAETIPDLVCGYHLAIARPRKAVNGQYLYFALSSRRCRKQFVRNANGVTRFGLTLAGVQNIELPLPSADEQEAFAQLLSAGEREIAALDTERTALAKQRDALASQLLTGRLRVPEAERLAAAG